MNKSVLILLVGSAFSPRVSSLADERIWLNAEIDGKPARLCFDSGSNVPMLTPRAVHKLGLKFIAARTNEYSHPLVTGRTAECALTLEGTRCTMSFLVMETPGYVEADFDGFVSWWALNRNLMQIDALDRKLAFFRQLPPDIAKWTRLRLLTNSGTLDAQIARADGTDGVICIDTGSDSGLDLPPDAWRVWSDTHARNPRTLQASFSPADGFVVREAAWADEFALGPISLTDLPVAVAGKAIAARWGSRYEGTLGLAALSRLDLIVDGTNGVAYVRAKATPPVPYSHNRLGAVFVPTGVHKHQGVARVVEGGPAFEAGVRDGDILLEVDEIPVKGWNQPWRSRFELPAGTKIRLKLNREGTNIETTATLREILQPNPSKSK